MNARSDDGEYPYLEMEDDDRLEAVAPDKEEIGTDHGNHDTDGHDHTDADAKREHRLGRIVTARAAGLSYRKTAKFADCGERTVRRTCEDPAVRARIDARRAEMSDEADGQLISLASKAIATVEESLSADRISDRLTAARMALGQVNIDRERIDIANRLDDLERQIQDLLNRPGGGTQ